MAKRQWRYWEPTFQADEVCDLNPVWPWGGHRAFAYDLVRWMRPGRIVELGVHWGTSFFTFAQAVKDGRMKGTELIGVDTFEGEDHAGHYGPEVLETVQGIVAKHFAKQSITLHRMLFEKALGKVEDGSTDLIHIDGLHTYEAVKEDFETWLPKLAPDGVMLFHDVAPDTGYGSTDFWHELLERHPGFTFEHSWGLGVLFPKGEGRLEELREQSIEDKILVYTHMARAERAGHEIRDLTRMADDRAEGIKKQGEMIRQRDESIEKLRAELESSGTASVDLRKRLESAERMAKERFEAIQKQTEMVANRDEAIEKLQERLEKSKALVQDRLEALRQATGRANELGKTVATLERRAAGAESARDELRGRVEDLRSRAHASEERLDRVLATREEANKKLDDLREQNASLREKLAHAAAGRDRMREELQAARKAQTAVEDRLDELSGHLATLAASHQGDRESTRDDLEKLAGAIGEARKASDAAARVFAARLARLDTDTELLGVRAEYVLSLIHI